MENIFTNTAKQFIFGCIGLVAGVFMATGVQYVFAWAGPTATPPGNNVPAPINVGSTGQAKAGTIGATRFYDDDTNYYIDANSVSYLNDIRPNILYDRQDTGYYLDPNGVSRLNDIRPNIMYDGQNTGYYVDPNGTSRTNYTVSDNTYVYGNENVNDVYFRSIGKWASQLGRQLYYCPAITANWVTCAMTTCNGSVSINSTCNYYAWAGGSNNNCAFMGTWGCTAL